MSLGLTLFTLFHVALSFAGIFSGFVVMFGFLTAKRLDGWTAIFLATTVATTVTGFLFPFRGFTPAIGTGIVSMVVLGMALYARYGRRMTRGWRNTYVISAVVAVYLNVFVLVVQAFLKVPALKALAPKQNEPPFAITQLLVLVIFIALGIFASIRFRLEPCRAL